MQERLFRGANKWCSSFSSHYYCTTVHRHILFSFLMTVLPHSGYDSPPGSLEAATSSLLAGMGVLIHERKTFENYTKRIHTAT